MGKSENNTGQKSKLPHWFYLARVTGSFQALLVWVCLDEGEYAGGGGGRSICPHLVKRRGDLSHCSETFLEQEPLSTGSYTQTKLVSLQMMAKVKTERINLSLHIGFSLNNKAQDCLSATHHEELLTILSL